MKFSCLSLCILLGILFVLIPLYTSTTQAQQTFGCPQRHGTQWERGATVYYSFENITDETQINQIKLALERWQTANTQNCSGVKFIQGTPPAATSPKLKFRNGIISNPFGAAKFGINDSIGGILYSAQLCSILLLHSQTSKPALQLFFIILTNQATIQYF